MGVLNVLRGTGEIDDDQSDADRTREGRKDEQNPSRLRPIHSRDSTEGPVPFPIVKIPKSLQETAAPVDPAPVEGGVEVHLALYTDPNAEPRRFAGVFVSAPTLDEHIEIPGESEVYRVVEVRRSVSGLVELKPDASGALDAAYERLAKRGVPFADEIVFIVAESVPEDESGEEAETVGTTD